MFYYRTKKHVNICLKPIKSQLTVNYLMWECAPNLLITFKKKKTFMLFLLLSFGHVFVFQLVEYIHLS
jgi:hypothetical protein